MASGAIGLVRLVASTAVVGYGNYLQVNGGTPAQAASIVSVRATYPSEQLHLMYGRVGVIDCLHERRSWYSNWSSPEQG